MFWRRLSLSLLSLLVFFIPIEHKYDKLFRLISRKLVPAGLSLPPFFEKKIYFYGSDLIALVLALIAICFFRISMRRFFLSQGACFLWAIFIFSLLSILFSPLYNYPLPYTRLLQLGTSFLLFSFLSSSLDAKDIQKWTTAVFICILFAAVFQSCIAIAQYFHQGSLGLRFLGEQDRFAVLSVAEGKRWIFDTFLHRKIDHHLLIRPSGTLPHANVLGGFLCISLLASYSLLSHPRLIFFVACTIPLQFFAMILSFSRSAIFAWFIGTIIWFSQYLKTYGLHKTFAHPVIRSGALAICISAILGVGLFHEQIAQRGGFVNYHHGVMQSDRQRIEAQRTAFGLIQSHPFLGVGFQQYSLGVIRQNPHTDPHRTPIGVHNIYLYLAAEAGLFSLCALLIFLCRLVWSSFLSVFTLQRASLLSMMTAFLFIGFCDMYPILFQQGRLLFFLTAGFLAAHLQLGKEKICRQPCCQL